MGKKLYSVIVGTGSYIPTRIVKNEDFLNKKFYDKDGKQIEGPTEEIIKKFEAITDIHERRYVTDDLVASDIAFFAAEDALNSSKIDKESLDYIIVAHNFGDIKVNSGKSDFLPSLAARVKHRLGIQNPKTVAYDVPFGCPGWLQGIIQADYYLKSGDAKRALIIGAETLSRISDPYDRDSMIYADGAGATILEGIESEKPVGILSHTARSDSAEHAYMLWLDKSNNPLYDQADLFLKMNGRKIYEYAVKTVPQVVKNAIEMAKLYLFDIKKVLIHQANGKMDDAILKRIFRLFGEKVVPPDIMPMTISKLGNTSVATIPTLLDLLFKGQLDNHSVQEGDCLAFASVGAGMSINSLIYKIQDGAFAKFLE